ncbi:hypothetical protein GCM10023205_40770 [Yinghuangia aomiensis]|uniref:Uncharacterized protein n=1 Tax=Yinghuangia aomiensis TaxID=676205 RepID=A0ABP9HH74_9ACTN
MDVDESEDEDSHVEGSAAEACDGCGGTMELGLLDRDAPVLQHTRDRSLGM